MENKELKEKWAQLIADSNGCLNGRVSSVEEDIYLIECLTTETGSVSCLKIYPQLSELRENKNFVFACIKYFAEGHEDAFLVGLCKWFAGKEEETPILDTDLFNIPGDFHKDVVFFEGNEPMTRKRLIDSIEYKFRNGYVLDYSRMKCDRIAYENGECDFIVGVYLPCLVINNEDEVAVDYFERGEYTSLKEQVGITSCSEYTMDFIQTPYLHHILYSMVKP